MELEKTTLCSNVCCVLTALIEYKNISKKTLQESIESEMSGNLEKLLVAVGEKNASLSLFITLSLKKPLHFTVITSFSPTTSQLLHTI